MVAYTSFFWKPHHVAPDKQYGIKLPYNKLGDRRILFVLDYVPSEDLESRKLLSGETGQLLRNLLKLARDRFLIKDVENPSWLAVNFNAYRTAGQPDTFQRLAHEDFTERLKAVILKYKPDTVVTFGVRPFTALAQDCFNRVQGHNGNNEMQGWLGTYIPRKLLKHRYNLVPSLSLDTLKRDRNTIAMAGVVAQHLANVLYGDLQYKISNEDPQIGYVDSLSKFKKMLPKLQQAGCVSVDTETANLNKIKNRLLTIQFAIEEDAGYFLPIYHKDTPFTAPELEYIKDGLREFFETGNDNEYHIYTNAKFDLNVMRIEDGSLGVRHFKNDVWDILGGQMALEENWKVLSTFPGCGYYYSLGNLAMQYGSDIYLRATFSKKDRKNIAAHPLDKELILYGVADVCIPFRIHKQQIKQAQHIKYKKYQSVVREQISDIIQVFSKMEHVGAGLDVDYLFHLKLPNSPIEQAIKKIEAELYATEGVTEANRLLAKKQGISSKGLFGNVIPRIFSFRKEDHKHLLYFKVLGLEPVSKGVSGKGKLDAVFQDTYKEYKEVSQFTALGKAKKLKNSYVNQFINLLGTDEDLKSDNRIRPSFEYLPVVTGRTSAHDPSLHQIPSRGELGKHIKRLFIAKPGTLYIKVDFRVHEVRGWAIISLDEVVAESFAVGKRLRDQFKLTPTTELAKRVEFEADVHVINSAFFFSKKLAELIADEKLRKELRNAVKAVVFGLIYGRSIKSLARVLGKAPDYVENLVKQFFKKFSKGMKWLLEIEQFAQKHYYVESPLGRRRNLWGYLMPEDCDNSNQVYAEMNRRARNSPIQGMGSDFAMMGARILDNAVWSIGQDRGELVELEITNAVHDALENQVGYKDFMLSLRLIEDCLTTEVAAMVKKRHNFDLISELEIDYEIGACLSKMKSWDFSYTQLETIVKEALEFQKTELKYKVNVGKIMDLIFHSKQSVADMPKWLRNQQKNFKSETRKVA